jgi:tetratricopeptide (TPR) repeat protein
MKNKDGEKLLLQGQRLRERGKTLEALNVLNIALEAFVKEKNYARFTHALLDRAICWQHLHQFNNNDFAFAILYKKDAEAMLEIVKAKNIKTQIAEAYFINGKAQMFFANYKQAEDFFSKALKKLSVSKKAQRGDWLTNFGKAKYLNGQKQKGLKEILDGIDQLKKHRGEIGQYIFKVWLSGGYLRLAETLTQDSPKESKQYLKQARMVIESDPRQIVRKKQLENFIKSGFSGL